MLPTSKTVTEKSPDIFGIYRGLKQSRGKSLDKSSLEEGMDGVKKGQTGPFVIHLKVNEKKWTVAQRNKMQVR